MEARKKKLRRVGNETGNAHAADQLPRVYLHCCPIKTLSTDDDTASQSFWCSWCGEPTEKAKENVNASKTLNLGLLLQDAITPYQSVVGQSF